MVSQTNVIPLIDPLAELQKDFCLVRLSGEVRVADRQQIAGVLSGKRSGEVWFYRQCDAKLLMRRALEALPVTSKPNQVIDDFFVNHQTHIYDVVAFSPLPQPVSTLNYWVGSPVQPLAGSWSVIEEFVLCILCNNNRRFFNYLVCYIAHMLQRPGEKPGVIIVLLGGQGTGKGTLFRLLRAIWSQTCLMVSDIGHVVGGFNAGIERNYVICMDEALFEGDKKALDRLKSLVSEPTVTIEQKYQPRREIESYHRFFAASNHKHFAQVDADDRRFFFLRVSEARKGDRGYWDSVYKAIDNPAVIAAMVHDLLKLDLTTFNVRDRPKTAEHIEQKLRSLAGFDRYWFEVLQSGGFNPGSGFTPCNPWDAPVFVSTSTLQRGWQEYAKGVRQFAPQQERDLHEGMKRLCPAAKKDRQQDHNRQERGYQLPALPAARVEFGVFIGGKVKWDA